MRVGEAPHRSSVRPSRRPEPNCASRRPECQARDLRRRTCAGRLGSAPRRPTSADGLEASDLTRVKELEAENAKLKRVYAELALDNAAMTMETGLGVEKLGAYSERFTNSAG